MSPVPGPRLVSNALAAIAVAVAGGATIEQAADALTHARITPKLQAKSAASGATILDDSYNANPASMAAALDLLQEMPGRRFALLGDMLELGSEEVPGHRSVGEHAARVVDTLFTVGPRGAQIATAARAAGAPSVYHFETKEAALDALRSTLGRGDVILIKASLGLGLSTVVADLIATDGRESNLRY
jgi:UDP-N-acetylmuramoyl-tripeptide--D-alanyl-D-alanine ligase